MLCFMMKICHIVENKNYVKNEKKKINNTARFEHWLQELQVNNVIVITQCVNLMKISNV